MLRDAGVRTKLLAVLAIPTVLLVVVTALLVGGQVTAARRAGQVNALTDVAIQVNRVVHSLQEERSATLRLPAGPAASGTQAADARPAPVHQPAAADPARRWSPPRRSTRCPSAVQAAVGRSAAGHDELASARRVRSTPAASSPPRPTSSTPRSSAPTSTCPGVVASSGTTELAQRLQAYEALSTAHRVRRPRARPGRGRPAARHA